MLTGCIVVSAARVTLAATSISMQPRARQRADVSHRIRRVRYAAARPTVNRCIGALACAGTVGSESAAMEIVELTGVEAMRVAFPLIKQLRPHLDEPRYIALLADMV